MSARQKYYCLECEVSASATREEALAELAAGHTLFVDPGPMPRADALADLATYRVNVSERADEPYRLGGWVVAAIAEGRDAFALARSAAHQAFAQVPGLRG